MYPAKLVPADFGQVCDMGAQFIGLPQQPANLKDPSVDFRVRQVSFLNAPFTINGSSDRLAACGRTASKTTRVSLGGIY